jgi:cytochrome c-type biogenesis protein CcmF
VVDSVHVFSNSTIGPVLLGFFGVIVAVTVGLIGWRGDRLRAPGRIDSPLSREGAFLANNVIFAAFAFVVLLGTVFPLIVEAVNGDRISIGTPYFERMSMPIGMVLLFLMAVAPVLPWRKASGELLSQRLFWPAWGAVGAMAIAVAVGARGVTPLIAYGLGGFAGGAALRQIVLAARRQGWRGFIGRANGGMVVHLGVIIIAIGLVSSASFIHQQELQLTEGQTGTVAGHEITFRGLTTKTLPEKTVTQAQLQIDGGKSYAPGISVFAFSGQNIGTPSVRTTLTHDIMLTVLAFPEAPGEPVTVRVVVQPMIIWLWIGGAVMAIGTLFAAFPGRRRNPLAPTSALTPSSEPLDGRRATATPVGASARVAPVVEG